MGDGKRDERPGEVGEDSLIEQGDGGFLVPCASGILMEEVAEVRVVVVVLEPGAEHRNGVYVWFDDFWGVGRGKDRDRATEQGSEHDSKARRLGEVGRILGGGADGIPVTLLLGSGIVGEGEAVAKALGEMAESVGTEAEEKGKE